MTDAKVSSEEGIVEANVSKNTSKRSRRRKRQKKKAASKWHSEERLKEFQAAGLPFKGIWTPSQRNKAKRIIKSEPEPGKDFLDNFDSKWWVKQ